MNETNSSSNIMINDPDKSFYVEFKPKADSSWTQRAPLADTILGFTESMMNLSVSGENLKAKGKKVAWKESKKDGVITVFDSDEEKEIVDQAMDMSVIPPEEKILGQSHFFQRKEKPMKQEESSLDRFKLGYSDFDSKDFKDFELPETDTSDLQRSLEYKSRDNTDDSMGMTLERYESAKQETGESKSEYFARLRQLARKHFEEEVKRQILEEEKSKAITALKDFSYGPSPNRLRGRNYYKPCWDRKRYGIQKRFQVKNHGTPKNSPRYNRSFPKPCRRCAKMHLPIPTACPAWNKFCHKCGRSNHFSSVCHNTF